MKIAKWPEFPSYKKCLCSYTAIVMYVEITFISFSNYILYYCIM